MKQEYKIKRKLHNAHISLYGDYQTKNKNYCFLWTVSAGDFCPEIKECPKFEKTSLENLTVCQICSNFKERLQYEICKDEYNRVHDKKVCAKQELQNAIKQSLKKFLSKGK